MDAARQRDERWMQQMCNVIRNGQQGQQQLQHNEEEDVDRMGICICTDIAVSAYYLRIFEI